MPIVALTSWIAAVIFCFLRELRFPPDEILHWGSRFEQAAMSPAERKDRNTDAMRVRDIRIILLTLAFACALPIPSLSLLCSFTAVFLLLMVCARVSYTREKRNDIMSQDEEDIDGYPPGYETWSESKRYLYRMQRQVRVAKQVDKEVQAAVSREFPDGTIQIERDLLKPGYRIDDTVVLPTQKTEQIQKTLEYLEKLGNGD